MLKDPGMIALRAVQDAEDNIGVHEQGGENAGKYVEIYLASVGLGRGAPWCAAFVNYRLYSASKELKRSLPNDFPRSGYCPDYKSWAVKHGVWIPLNDVINGATEIKRGDQCLFYFEAKGRVAHTGLVAKRIDKGVATVEGNTSPAAGVDRDGDGVYPKTRKWGAFGAGGGFVRMAF